MKSKILTLGIVICIIFGFFVMPTHATDEVWDGSVASGFESGDGTEENPYIIKTASQLAYLAQSVSNGTTYEGRFIKLANDIVLNTPDMFATDANGNITGAADGKTPNEWTTIGNRDYGYSFSGNFDGDNNEISGIYINNSNKNNQGLFGYCKNATVKNVSITGGYICGKYCLGGVVGYNYAYGGTGTVSNCHNSSTLTGEAYIGGVVGYNYAAPKNTAIVENCYNMGTVSGKYDIGGVAGYCGYEGTSTTAVIVRNCDNAGIVSGEWTVGGVIGFNIAYDGGKLITTENCYNIGEVNGKYWIGGICGLISGSGDRLIKNCYNAGAVSGNYRAGGIAGTNAISGKGNVTIEHCYNVGTITGGYYVGSIFGENSPYGETATVSITGCYYLNGCATDKNKTSQYGMGNETAGQTTADADGETIGLSAEQMKNSQSFVGFDFDTVWTMEGNPYYEYPKIIGMNYIENVWDGSIAKGFESGNGTEENPYIIKTAPQLAYLAKTVNIGITYGGKFIKLANDIVLNTPDMFAYDENGSITGAADGKTPNEWTTIGRTYDYSFSGNFNGDNHKISGIYINKPDNGNQGLFGYCTYATIKNVGITGGYVRGSYRIGGAIGYNDSGTVSNCYNTSKVYGSDRGVGGVVGYNDSGTILYCHNTGIVSGNGSVGGVAGSNVGAISNCHNTGIVSGNSSVGGVSGGNGGTVSNCYNTGDIIGNNSVGGVAGSNDGMVSNCYNTGTVSGNNYDVGGLVGNNYGSVSNCYNTGDIIGNNPVGGVVGHNDGIVGTPMVSNCYNAGTIIGKGHVGGIVGLNCIYDNNSRIVTVSNCYNTGKVSGNVYVGGITGENYFTVGSVGTITVSNCYNAGTISGNRCVGGIAGWNDNGTIIVTGCYYLKGSAKDKNETVQCGIGNKTAGEITLDESGKTSGLTREELKNSQSFVGFDFNTFWTMKGNPAYPYPELIGLYHDGYIPPHTETKIIKIGNSCNISVKQINLENCKVIVVGYKNNKVSDMEILNSDSLQTVFTGDFDTFKVMAWENLSSLKPLCDAETIPQSQWIVEQ